MRIVQKSDQTAPFDSAQGADYRMKPMLLRGGFPSNHNDGRRVGPNDDQRARQRDDNTIPKGTVRKNGKAVPLTGNGWIENRKRGAGCRAPFFMMNPS